MEEFIGRQVAFAKNERPDGDFLIREAVTITTQGECQRCGSVFSTAEHLLPSGKYYCPQCIQFGRLTNEQVLVSQLETQLEPRSVAFAWQGSLTPAQQAVADKIVQNQAAQRHSLIWAVTGSGKTEMIFPIIQKILRQGGRVCVTSPRIDVCRELYPRICQAFPKEHALLLYGDSEEAYRYSPLTICTTHQLLHFYRAFDLLIIDEIDAFPYEGNPQLRYALIQALKINGSYIYLTATPPEHLLQEIHPSFAIEKLPIRYHQRPLIVPELCWYESWAICQRQKWRLRKLLRCLRTLLKDNAVLVFCPSIVYMNQLYAAVAPHFPKDRTACVSSQDDEREAKVQKMRDQGYQILFTSTILERGVTFEKVSVIVMGANHAVFTKSALVQIAGRVDRKGDFLNGRVIFFLNQQTAAIRAACAEIKAMNQLAQRWRTDEM